MFPSVRPLLAAFFVFLLVSAVFLPDADATGGQITGRVTDSTGAPLSGVVVSLSSSNSCGGYDSHPVNIGTPFVSAGGTISGTTETSPTNGISDANGVYTYSNIPDGTYRIRFSKAGYISSWYATTGQSSTPITFTGSDITLTDIDAVLEPGATIAGLVVDQEGAIVKDAYVAVYSDNGGYTSGAVSDANGRYTVDGLTAGSYRLEFRKSGFIPVWYNGASSYGEATKITLAAAETKTGVNAVLGTGGKISGHVLDVDGKPITNVGIGIFTDSTGYAFSIPTNENGNYTISGLKSGIYKLEFNSSGYSNVWYGGTASQADATEIQVAASESKNGIDVVMGKGGKLTGTVTDLAGNPMEFVNVQIFSHLTGYITTYTNNNGLYEIKGIPSGSYSVTFNKSGYVTTPHLGSDGQPAFVSITAPDAAVVVNACLEEGGTVTGVVRDMAGTLINGVRVELINSSGSSESTIAYDNGRYNFSGVGKGSYKLRFTKAGYLTAWYGGITQESATAVTISSTNVAATVDMVLDRGGRIGGRVLDKAGMPLSGVNVSVNRITDTCTLLVTSNAQPGFPASSCSAESVNGITDPNGNYTYSGLETGLHFVSFSKQGFVTANLEQPVWVNSTEETLNVNAVLEHGGSLAGKITDKDGAALLGVSVYVYTTSGEFLTGSSTDTGGLYVVGSLPTGSYKLQFHASGYASLWYGGTADQMTATEVLVNVPATTAGIDAVMGIGGEITGNVRDINGAPLRNVHVGLYSSDGSYQSANTDLSGNFSITGLANGSYTLLFDRYEYISVWSGGASDQSTAMPLTVSSPDSKIAMAVVMRLGGKITGVVTDASGAPINGVNVHAASNTSGVNAYTDATGAYSINGLETGTYNVQFDRPGSMNMSGVTASVVVTAGKAIAGIDYSFNSGGKISGQVKDSNGSPLSNVRVYINSPIEASAYTFTDNNGNYSFENLPDGSYGIFFSKAGFISSVYMNENGAVLVLVTAPNTISGINAVLKASGKITGRVTDASGQPIQGASVIVEPFRYPTTQGVTISALSGVVEPNINSTATFVTSSSCSTTTSDGYTDADGNFSYSGLDTGTYQLTVYKNGYEPASYGGIPGASISAISVVAPNTTSAINVILQPVKDTTAPSLYLSSPADNLITNQMVIKVMGAAYDYGSPATVVVNGKLVSVTWGGSFSSSLNLIDGINTISVVATDSAGNQAVVTRTVTLDRTALPSGDVDGDSAVNIADALRALKIAVGAVAPSTDDIRGGDVAPLVNGKPAPDGQITIDDALVIVKKALGLLTW